MSQARLHLRADTADLTLQKYGGHLNITLTSHVTPLLRLGQTVLAHLVTSLVTGAVNVF